MGHWELVIGWQLLIIKSEGNIISKSFQEFRVYRLSEQLADEIWKIVNSWEFFAKDTGKQIVRSADSVGANIVEGLRRGSYL